MLFSYVKKSMLVQKYCYGYGLFIKFSARTLLFNSMVNFLTGKKLGGYYFINISSNLICPERLILSGNKKGTISSLVLSHGCYIQAANGVEIGEGTIWGPNVAIVSANHNPEDNGRAWLTTAQPIKIGRNCWIGANAVILPGVTIGDSSVIGAGAVVTKSFPVGRQVIAGNPAHIIRDI